MPLLSHIHDLWHVVPLTVSVSLVYAATRYEQMGAILTSAARFGSWVVGFMLAAFGLLYWLSAGL